MTEVRGSAPRRRRWPPICRSSPRARRGVARAGGAAAGLVLPESDRLLPPPAAAWEKRWTKSTWKVSDGTAGDFKLTAGKWYGDAEAGKGIQTGPDARFFASTATFPKFSNEGSDLVLQASLPPARGARRGVSVPTGRLLAASNLRALARSSK